MTIHKNSPSQSSSALSGERAVIINVDDLGLSDAVNDAVLALAEAQRISASSYMVGGRIAAADIRALETYHIDIGLHLDLTGIFPSALRGSLKSIIVASYLRKFNPAQVTDIINQQLDAFEDTFNRAPIFIDGHQHIHQFPTIRQRLVQALHARYGADAQTAVRARVTTPLINDIKSWIIYMLGGHAWQRLCTADNIATNDYFGGVYDFDADMPQLACLWQQWLQKAPLASTIAATQPITAIMCHPAVPEYHWQDEIKVAREREYAWLMSPQFGDILNEYKINLVHWSACH